MKLTGPRLRGSGLNAGLGRRWSGLSILDAAIGAHDLRGAVMGGEVIIVRLDEGTAMRPLHEAMRMHGRITERPERITGVLDKGREQPDLVGGSDHL